MRVKYLLFIFSGVGVVSQWILNTGFWDDVLFWVDEENWID
jgi:hypothetical protein